MVIQAEQPAIDAHELLRMIHAAPGSTITLFKDQLLCLVREIAAGNAARAMLAHADWIDAAIDGMIAGDG